MPFSGPPASAFGIDHIAQADPPLEWEVNGAHVRCVFTAPWDGWVLARPEAHADINAYGTHNKAALLSGLAIVGGASVTLNIPDGVALELDGTPVTDHCRYVPRAAPAPIPTVAWDSAPAYPAPLSA
ncbi:MAG: hypothetical protein KF833_18640 [Verrucomicrobiae bacterium]|nr:hypothetical protein [Verrucomicrobiae bacterium]